MKRDSDLKTLREKENIMLKEIDDDIDSASGEITVIQLVEKYIALKEGVRYNTKAGYIFAPYLSRVMERMIRVLFLYLYNM